MCYWPKAIVSAAQRFGRSGVASSTGRRNTLSQREKDGVRPIRQRFRSRVRAAEKTVLWDRLLRGVAEKHWASVYQAVIVYSLPAAPRCCVDRLRPPVETGHCATVTNWSLRPRGVIFCETSLQRST